jgi:hypothetical protein
MNLQLVRFGVTFQGLKIRQADVALNVMKQVGALAHEQSSCLAQTN